MHHHQLTRSPTASTGGAHRRCRRVLYQGFSVGGGRDGGRAGGDDEHGVVDDAFAERVPIFPTIFLRHRAMRQPTARCFGHCLGVKQYCVPHYVQLDTNIFPLLAGDQVRSRPATELDPQEYLRFVNSCREMNN